MSASVDGRTPERGRVREDELTDVGRRPGQGPLVGAALAIGILLLGVQLWILAVALDLYLGGGAPGQLWLLAAVSGLIFLGGLGVLWVLRRGPRLREPAGDEARYSVGAWGHPPPGD